MSDSLEIRKAYFFGGDELVRLVEEGEVEVHVDVDCEHGVDEELEGDVEEVAVEAVGEGVGRLDDGDEDEPVTVSERG